MPQTSARPEQRIVYRKTKYGDWAVRGPVDKVQAGTTVEVTRKDGSTKVEHVLTVGEPFRLGVTDVVYGYLAASAVRDLPPGGTGIGGPCEHCGKGRARFTRTDRSGLEGFVCFRCNSLADDELAFL